MGRLWLEIERRLSEESRLWTQSDLHDDRLRSGEGGLYLENLVCSDVRSCYELRATPSSAEVAHRSDSDDCAEDGSPSIETNPGCGTVPACH